ncbi:TetR/AcrR family transcriptional regulator C-terminal domain-containing protein [Actinoplanes sp. NPDC049599]|uniref:TetR/AcrR family transcriptional regulator C-terminal domain-containing protein n=1 Tax=Actinoplanes sp. NPDC049599 TaxID=3363903 RepID=UPI0037BCE1A7
MVLPPYRRIAEGIAARIAAGELAPGDRIASTRRLTAEHGIAMATATKVIAALREQGLVRAVPGVGTVVTDQPRPTPAPAAPDRAAPDRAAPDRAAPDRAAPDRAAPAQAGPDQGGTDQGGSAPARRKQAGPGRAGRSGAGEDAPDRDRDRVVRAAVAIADAEGLAGLSMRRLAGELGMPTMSLYRHVTGREELLLFMMESVFARNPPPELSPESAGWRACVEALARLQWAMYRRHPWLSQAINFTRPLLAPRAMAHTEWTMRALDGHGLAPDVLFLAAATVANYIRGTAVNLEDEAQAEQETGLTDHEWLDTQQGRLGEILNSGHYPLLARAVTDESLEFDVDRLLDFGLQRLLDGLAPLLER